MLAACSGGPAVPDDVSAVAFLEGCWSRDDLQECWARDGAQLNGLGKLAGVVSEVLVIEPSGSGLVYLASPAGQDTVAFQMTASTETSARFDNPAHDFPKWIRYELTGDTLVGTIGTDTEPAATFTLHRSEP